MFDLWFFINPLLKFLKFLFVMFFTNLTKSIIFQYVAHIVVCCLRPKIPFFKQIRVRDSFSLIRVKAIHIVSKVRMHFSPINNFHWRRSWFPILSTHPADFQNRNISLLLDYTSKYFEGWYLNFDPLLCAVFKPLGTVSALQKKPSSFSTLALNYLLLLTQVWVNLLFLEWLKGEEIEFLQLLVQVFQDPGREVVKILASTSKIKDSNQMCCFPFAAV